MDPTFLTLRDEAIKTEQAVENASEKKKGEKVKLESVYKSLSKTEDELKSIYLDIESDRKKTTLPLHQEYHDSYWNWKDAVAVNEIAQTKFSKYETNINKDIPDVMIELKEVKQQNKELKETFNEKVEALNTEMNNFRTASVNQIRAIYMKFSSPSLKLTILSIIVCLFAMNTLWTTNTIDKSLVKQSEVYHEVGGTIMIELKELKNEMKELKNEVKELKQGKEEQRKEEQRQEELERQRKLKEYFSSITPPFNGNKEVDIVFPEPVEARYITFKPKSWETHPYFRCDVYVDNVLQNTPLSQRSVSSYYDDKVKDSTMNALYGWLYKQPYNANEWLKLDLQQCKTITGIRVGTCKGTSSQYISNFALEFGN